MKPAAGGADAAVGESDSEGATVGEGESEGADVAAPPFWCAPRVVDAVQVLQGHDRGVEAASGCCRPSGWAD